MYKRIFSILLLLSVLLTGGLGCKGTSAEQTAAIQPVTLNYWTIYDDYDQLNKFIEAYKVVRPYVTINLRQVRYEEFDDAFVSALADDVGPDIVSLHTRWLRRYQPRLAPMPASVKVASITVTGQYVKETVITILNNKMPTVNNIVKDYVTTVKNDVILGGEIYGLPLSMDMLALYYNVDLLDKAGVPEPPKTWEEFLTAVKKSTKFNSTGKITQSGVALGTGNNIDNAADILALLMMQNGVTVSRSGRVSFADGISNAGEDHPAMQALRFYTDFARPTKEVYSWNEEKENAFESFVTGRSVFYFGFAFDGARIKTRAPQLNLSIIPVPQLNEQSPANVANYWVESVVKKSKHQNEAWDFIRFMTLAQNTKAYVDATGQPSPLRAQIAVQQETPELAPFASQALTAVNWYEGRNYEATKSAFASLMHDYVQPYGDRDVPAQRDAGLIQRTAIVVQQTY